MGTCLGKEKQRVKKEKVSKKNSQAPSKEISSPCAVKSSPPPPTASSCDSVVMASPGHSYISSSTSLEEDLPAAETFSMFHLERKNPTQNLIRVSASEGNQRFRPELPSPASAEAEDSNPIDQLEYVVKIRSPRNDKRHQSPIKRMFTSPPRVLFKSTHLGSKQLSSIRREKNNSTSSMYIKDTINAPNVDEVMKCMATALQYHIKNGIEHPTYIHRAFSEKYFPLNKNAYVDLVNLPEIITIYRFVNMIFGALRIQLECAILCLAYIERVISTSSATLHPENWRRILLGAILIAAKVWEDDAVWNSDFLDVFPLDLTLEDLNRLEKQFMALLQFNVQIKGSEYAKYYFELRALSHRESFPLQPLNKKTQKRLEERSQKTEAESKLPNGIFGGAAIKRAKSVDCFDPKSPTVVLA